jgi:hypothetical protein
MHGTGMEKEVEICATNITNKTKCKNIIAKKWNGFQKRIIMKPQKPELGFIILLIFINYLF